MSETNQIISGILLLILIFIFTRKVSAWRVKRAIIGIIKDLERHSAVDPSSAVVLTYARTQLFRFGTRDFRPKALESLVASGVVGLTEDGRYYLKERADLLLSRLNQ